MTPKTFISFLSSSSLELCFCFLCLMSCVEDVDFDQPTDIVLTPVIESSLVFLEVQGSRFVDNGSEIETVSDAISDIEIFQDEFIDDNLEKVEIVFEVNNQIERQFNLQVDLVDEAMQLQRSIMFSVLPSVDGETIITEHIETFEMDTIDQLINTHTMVFSLRLQPSSDGSMLNENSTDLIELDSKGRFYFRIEQ